MHHKFDLLIIGGGSGGIAAAATATNLGAKCVVIEQSHLGGICANLGCIPKKMLWYAAITQEAINYGNAIGFSSNNNNFDWQYFLNKRTQHINNIRNYFNEYLSKKKITLISGAAKFIDKNTIIVENKPFSADHIVIATGAKPKIPDIPGADYGITSDDFFLLEKQPQKIAIVGSSYIALELSCILQALGSEVTLIIRGNKILKSFDAIISDALLQHLENNKLKVIKQTSISKIEKLNNGFRLYAEEISLSDTYDNILWAIGREPNIKDLNLTAANIQTNKDGTVKVDKNLKTTGKNIYAIGDVTPYPQLAPISIAHGKQLATKIFSSKIKNYNFTNIPTALFTIPPAGQIGLTEIEAIKKYGNRKIKIYQKKFTTLYDSLSSTPNPAAIKLICYGRNEKLIGCHIIAKDAHEIIQGFVVAMNKGITKNDLKYSLTIHPTIAEEILKF